MIVGNKNNSLFVLSLLVLPTTFAFRTPENPGVAGIPDLKKITPKATPVAPSKPAAEAAPTVVDMAAINAAAGKAMDWAADKKVTDIDCTSEDAYWYNPTIHGWGNNGFNGAVHAVLAPLSTWIIDRVAYDGEDVRSTVARDLFKKVRANRRAIDCNKPVKVLDMCCGVGMSTRALRDAFCDDFSDLVVGVDTSNQMLGVADFMTNKLGFLKPAGELFDAIKTCGHEFPVNADSVKKGLYSRRAKYANGNAESTNFPNETFDLVTIFYAFHEAPSKGRSQILREARRVLRPGGTLAVIDISPDYSPSPMMLSGEPYVLEYQKNINNQLRTFRGFSNVRFKSVVDNHVGMWTLKRNIGKSLA